MREKESEKEKDEQKKRKNKDRIINQALSLKFFLIKLFLFLVL